MVSVHVHLFVKKAVVWREFSPVSFFFFFTLEPLELMSHFFKPVCQQSTAC